MLHTKFRGNRPAGSEEEDGRTTDGRRLDWYIISSPCEPNGSGELKKQQQLKCLQKPIAYRTLLDMCCRFCWRPGNEV